MPNVFYESKTHRIDQQSLTYLQSRSELSEPLKAKITDRLLLLTSSEDKKTVANCT